MNTTESWYKYWLRNSQKIANIQILKLIINDESHDKAKFNATIVVINKLELSVSY